jgi:hypothetical protein
LLVDASTEDMTLLRRAAAAPPTTDFGGGRSTRVGVTVHSRLGVRL